jgi:hypothetical protein
MGQSGTTSKWVRRHFGAFQDVVRPVVFHAGGAAVAHLQVPIAVLPLSTTKLNPFDRNRKNHVFSGSVKGFSVLVLFIRGTVLSYI